eukprot:gb/GECG01002103.1/.p1 GENE.gb/GECG01002103.1/~~gb/GECG01002103.1/.p1  ORF type:complete len:786 (+),score=139.25 gb/GECG01002103.1/:1-2358(+)
MDDIVSNSPGTPNRRRRRNKRGKDKKKGSGLEHGAIENEPLPLQLQKLTEDYSKQEILKARNDLFETDEDYDDPEVVRKYLKGELNSHDGSEHSTSTPPISYHSHNARSWDSSAASISSAATPSGEHSNGGHEQQSQSQHSSASQDSKKIKEEESADSRRYAQATQLNASSIEEQKKILEQVVASSKLNDVLTGLNHWYNAASVVQVNCFFESDAPRRLLLNILSRMPHSEFDKLFTEVLEKLVTPLRMKPEERPVQLVHRCTKAVVTRMREVIESLRKVDPEAAGEKSEEARHIAARVMATQLRELRNFVGSSWSSMNGHVDCSRVLKQNEENVKQLPADKNDLRSLLMRRDLHFETMQALRHTQSRTHTEKLSGSPLMPKTVEDELRSLRALSGSGSDKTVVEEREAKEALEQLHKEIAESLGPLKEEEQRLSDDLEQLHQRRRELQQELNRINDDIKSKTREKKAISEKAEVLGDKFKEKKGVLNSRYNGMVARCEEEGVGVSLQSSIQGIVEDVDKVINELDMVGTREAGSMDEDTRRYHWAEQTFLSCQSDKLIINALKKRLEKSQGELVKLKNEAENFKSLNMKNVVKEVEKSLLRVSAEIKEDENSIATFTQQTRDYVRDFLHQYSMPEDTGSRKDSGTLYDKELAFVRRLCDIAVDLGLDNDFIESLGLIKPSQSALDFVDQHYTKENSNVNAPSKTPGKDTSHAENPKSVVATAHVPSSQSSANTPPRPHTKATATNGTFHRSSPSWGSTSGSNRKPVSLKDLRKRANNADNVSEA